MTALIVVVPLPEPELVIVPVLLSVVVEAVMAPVLLALKVRLPIPVTPPDSVKRAVVPLDVNTLLVAPTVTAPLTVSAEVLLASVMPVTFAPTAALIVVVPLLEPELVIVPVLLTLEPEIVIAPGDPWFTLSIKLPVPVTPPERVNNP